MKPFMVGINTIYKTYYSNASSDSDVELFNNFFERTKNSKYPEISLGEAATKSFFLLVINFIRSVRQATKWVKKGGNLGYWSYQIEFADELDQYVKKFGESFEEKTKLANGEEKVYLVEPLERKLREVVKQAKAEKPETTTTKENFTQVKKKKYVTKKQFVTKDKTSDVKATKDSVKTNEKESSKRTKQQKDVSPPEKVKLPKDSVWNNSVIEQMEQVAFTKVDDKGVVVEAKKFIVLNEKVLKEVKPIPEGALYLNGTIYLPDKTVEGQETVCYEWNGK